MSSPTLTVCSGRVPEAKGCGAAIFFRPTPAGFSMPLDPAPVDPEPAAGMFELVGEPGKEIAVALTAETAAAASADGRKAYVSHFATCPDSAAFRRRAPRRPLRPGSLGPAAAFSGGIAGADQALAGMAAGAYRQAIERLASRFVRELKASHPEPTLEHAREAFRAFKRSVSAELPVDRGRRVAMLEQVRDLARRGLIFFPSDVPEIRNPGEWQKAGGRNDDLRDPLDVRGAERSNL